MANADTPISALNTTKLVPADFCNTESVGKGEPVSFRIDPDFLRVVDEILQFGRSFVGFPRTRSDFARVAWRFTIREMMQSGFMNDWSKFPMLVAMHDEWELDAIASTRKKRVHTLLGTAKKLRDFVIASVNELQYKAAYEQLQDYLKKLADYQKREPDMAQRLITGLADDSALKVAIRTLRKHGYDVSLPKADAGEIEDEE